jgi:hypothetical protein
MVNRNLGSSERCEGGVSHGVLIWKLGIECRPCRPGVFVRIVQGMGWETLTAHALLWLPNPKSTIPSAAAALLKECPALAAPFLATLLRPPPAYEIGKGSRDPNLAVDDRSNDEGRPGGSEPVLVAEGDGRGCSEPILATVGNDDGERKVSATEPASAVGCSAPATSAGGPLKAPDEAMAALPSKECLDNVLLRSFSAALASGHLAERDGAACTAVLAQYVVSAMREWQGTCSAASGQYSAAGSAVRICCGVKRLLLRSPAVE